MLSQSEQGKETAGPVVDARSIARFRAEAPEPRAGVAGGHVPGSMCVPFTNVLVEGDLNRYGTTEAWPISFFATQKGVQLRLTSRRAHGFVMW